MPNPSNTSAKAGCITLAVVAILSCMGVWKLVELIIAGLHHLHG